MKKRRLVLLTICLIVAFVMAGCVKSQSEPVSEEGTNGTKTSDTSGETFEWRMASVWSQGSIQYDHDQRFVDTVNELSNGRLEIKLHSVGELAPVDQVLDTVSSGTVEMGADWPNYWSGKNTAFDLLGSQAVGMTNWDYLLWINEGGGQEMYNDIYGQFNTVYFPHTISGMESGIRSNEPIESLDDFKGLKIRMAGLIQEELVERLGATPTTIATQEIYESLQRGVIDAAEYSTPYADDVLKMQEVTDYWLTPGWHQSSATYGTLINEEAWESLPDGLQNVIEKASKVTMTVNSAEYAYKDAESTEKMLNEYGIKTTNLSDEDLNRLRDMTDEIKQDLADENPDFKKVLNSQMDFLEMYAPYRDLQGDWGFGSNFLVE